VEVGNQRVMHGGWLGVIVMALCAPVPASCGAQGNAKGVICCAGGGACTQQLQRVHVPACVLSVPGVVLVRQGMIASGKGLHALDNAHACERGVDLHDSS
jgi:hypothetical protein